MVKVHIPTTMRKFTEEQRLVEVPGTSVIGLFEGLEQRFPGMAGQLLDNGKLKSFIAVFVNSKDIRGLDGERSPLKDHDEVHIVPAIAGG